MIGSLFGIVQLQDSKFRGNEAQMDSVIEMTIGLFFEAVVRK